MCPRKVISLAAVAVVLCFNDGASSLTERTFKKEWKHPKDAIIKYAKPIATTDLSFLYVACTEQSSPAQLNCEIFRETPVDPWQHREHKRHRRHKARKSLCQLSLRNSHGNSSKEDEELPILVSLEHYPMADWSIVVSWERLKDSQYQVNGLGLSIVKLTDCSQRQLYLPLDVQERVLLSNVVAYPSGFDVFASNAKLCEPAASATCRLSFDQDGRRIEFQPPRAFETDFDSAQTLPVLPDSSSKGFYVSGTDVAAWKFRAMYLGPDGPGLSLMTARGVGDPRQLQRASTVGRELLLVCIDGRRKAHCAQFDAEGRLRLNATLPTPGLNIGWMALYNMAEGEALIAYGACGPIKCPSLKLHRLKASGEHEELLELPSLNLRCGSEHRPPQDLSAEILEAGRDLCFYFACSVKPKAQEQKTSARSDKDGKFVKYFVKCIPREELKL